MIKMVTTVEVVSGHEDAWRTLREARRQYPGFRGASLLRDSSQPSHYLVLSEWDGHDQLAEAMRGLSWLNRDLKTEWAAGPARVYDEVVDSVGDIMDAGTARKPMSEGSAGRPRAQGPDANSW